MSAPVKAPPRAVLSLAELLSDYPQPEPCLIEPGLLPSQGILFLGGEPKASTPEELEARLKSDIEMWAGVVKKAGLEPH